MHPLIKTIGLMVFSCFWCEVASADNCGSLSDCFYTVWSAAIAAVGIAVTLIVGSLLDFFGRDRQAETSISPSWTATDPTADVIVQDPHVRAEMEKAFAESHDNLLPDKDVREQGGWVVRSPSGKLDVVRWPEGESGSMTPPDKPDNAVAHFHTHPYGNDVALTHRPSIDDSMFTEAMGIPGFVIDRQGIIRIESNRPMAYHDVVLK